MLRRCVFVVLVMAPALRLGAAEEPRRTGPIVEGTRTHTARSAGRWRIWLNADRARIVCANKSFLWFAKGSHYWRYNVANRRIDVVASPLTHPELTDYLDIQMTADGKTLFSGYGVILLYDGRQWSRLPLPGGDGGHRSYVSFDFRGRIWTFGARARRWDGKKWSLGVKIPGNNGLWSIGDKWFMRNNVSGDRDWKIYTAWDAKFTAWTEYPAGTDKLSLVGREWAYQTNAGLVGVFLNWSEGYDKGMWRVRLITDTKMEELISTKFPIVDLVSGRAMALEPGAWGKPAKVRDAKGKEIASLPPPPIDLTKYRKRLVRDGNGDYWLDRWRCDGKEWREILPPGAFVYTGSVQDALRTGRLVFDKSQQTWVDAWREIPVKVIDYNPKTRTGWLTEGGKAGEMPVSRKYRFDADGSRRLLQKFMRNRNGNKSRFVCFEHGADTWFYDASRWDGHKYHQYENGWTGHMTSKAVYPALLRSPTGRIWMLHTNRFWQRYNPKTNAFERADPYDDFQFTVGDETFAILGDPRQRESLIIGGVYKKSAGQWRPLPILSQQSGLSDVTFSFPPLKGVRRRMVRDGRMLLSCSYGVFEIDLKTGRWAYLSNQLKMVAWFDDSGRRVMASKDDRGLILTYEGDPFIKPETLRQAGDTVERKVMALLKRMDNESWSIRRQASAEAVNLARKHPRAVADILQRAKLVRAQSLEVQSRMASVLDQMPGEDKRQAVPYKIRRGIIIGNSLQERMHPPMTPRCEYTIRPGMAFEHVQAILNAFGAVYSFDVQNHHLYRPIAPDKLCRGYILPGNTMLYICLEKRKSNAGKVLSLGLGKPGKGYDRKWDWSDTKANGLKTLELKANR